jgi:hypothetical protein
MSIYDFPVAMTMQRHAQRPDRNKAQEENTRPRPAPDDPARELTRGRQHPTPDHLPVPDDYHSDRG